MKRVLVVDDEPMVLVSVCDVLARSRVVFETELAVCAEEALEMLAERPKFDVIICDLRMPGMDGEALLLHVRENYPDVCRVVLSGDTRSMQAARVRALSHRFLEKPYPSFRLGQVICELVGPLPPQTEQS